jgi:hypothetical protein
MQYIFKRANLDVCPFCDGKTRSYFTLVSRFFAERASGSLEPQTTSILQCSHCHSMIFKSDFDEHQMEGLYKDYRGDEYFATRNKYEPWYTKSINSGIGDENEFVERRQVLLNFLSKNNIENNFESVLDHGGDRGQMITPSGGLVSTVRAVCEVSGVAPEEGVIAISNQEACLRDWNLILSCHVIEHLPDPFSYLQEIAALGNSQTIFFIEVPYEYHKISSVCTMPWYNSWLKTIARHKQIMMMFDLYSIATRRIFGVVLPGGFTALREHLQFFTTKGLEALLNRTGYDLIDCELGSAGHIIALAKKKSNA